MYFCRDILLGHHKEKNEKRLNYHIEEWYTSAPYDIFRDVSYYPTVFLLLDTPHRTDRCITVCGKLIFYSIFEFTFPLTQDCLNYICRGNGTNEIRSVGVVHAIIAVPIKVVQIILNIKY